MRALYLTIAFSISCVGNLLPAPEPGTAWFEGRYELGGDQPTRCSVSYARQRCDDGTAVAITDLTRGVVCIGGGVEPTGTVTQIIGDPADAGRALHPTGRAFVVLGRTCHEWSERTRDGGELLTCHDPVLRVRKSLVRVPLNEREYDEGLLLRSERHDAGGGEPRVVELTRLEIGDVADSTFDCAH